MRQWDIFRPQKLLRTINLVYTKEWENSFRFKIEHDVFFFFFLSGPSQYGKLQGDCSFFAGAICITVLHIVKMLLLKFGFKVLSIGNTPPNLLLISTFDYLGLQL